MPQDQDTRPTDETTSRPVEAEQPTAGAVSRMLANPRRTRRA